MSEPREKETHAPPTFTNRALWEPLRDAALGRIENAAADGTLWSLRQLPYVLFSWMRWRDEATVRTAIAAHVASDDELIAFVGACAGNSRSYSLGDKVARTHVRLSKKTVSSFLDVETTTARLRAIATKEGEHAEVASKLVSLLEKPSGPFDD